ncbi:MAG: thioredoxin [Turicibacter sp.]|nr:thioredoxin [Turicibacter sp.]
MSQVIKANEENFDQEISSGVTLVDFYADWCGPCKMISPVLDEIATEMHGIAKVVKVNVDEAQEIAQRYGVMSIPNLIVFKDGQNVQQAVGFQPKEALVSMINSNK